MGDEGLLGRLPGRGVSGADRDGLERAFAAFLAAAGVDRADPELAGTPGRAAQAWADELLDGYRTDPKAALGPPSAAPAGAGLVTVTHLDFTGVCPHHLLPWRGLAHVAYLPGAHLAGFGRLAALVDCLAHRLVLQETLARDVAQALVEHLGARGAGVVLEAEQTCMTLRGEKRTRSRARTEATAGAFGPDELRALRDAVQAGGGR